MLRENEIISKVLLTIDQYKGKVSSFRNGIANDDYYKSANYSRLLVWKVCLITDSLDISKWEGSLNSTRVVYSNLRGRSDLRIPWSRLDRDNAFYKEDAAIAKPLNSNNSKTAAPYGGHRKKAFKNVIERTTIDHDPLGSMGVASPSSTLSPSVSPQGLSSASDLGSALAASLEEDQDLDLLTQITLDIERIFPGNEFFHPTSTSGTSLAASRAHKYSIVRILYIWSKCNPGIGYKQGLHELVGLIYLNLCKESIAIPSTNTISTDDLKILKLYNSKYLANDTFSIFNKFINQSGIAAKYYEQESRLFESIQSFNVNLLKVDQLVHYNLTSKLKVESQLWLIRYFRLLLSRELGNDLEIVIRLWEKLICTSPSSNTTLASIPDIINFIIITLLIHIKTELITSDFSEALSLLLRYPISQVIKKYNSPEDFVHGIYKDSIHLYERRDKDLKLYEYGIKLNETYNPNLKFKMSYSGSQSRPTSQETVRKVDQSREEKLKFEKVRLEMRLKKKAQEMVKK
ncbi:GTPase-activating protein Gyp6p [[Candida] railenensis]|uniref:GTPase-activating protein Gyp6p n=1 Tax=[Candida] railenensis TaxID=45579 RepID=A0A9P0VWT5_9ASCO|nr:GTPase-activating protein Gyp6p [[Candida] railenensis]